MDEELMTRSYLEDPSFGRSFGVTAELSMDKAKIAGKDDLWLDDFEFAFASIKSDPDAATETDADKIFNNGQILPVYPIFNGDLVDGGLKPPDEEGLEGGIGNLAMAFEKKTQLSELKPSSSSISSEAKELDKLSVATAAYCVLKSNSTGSVALEPRRLRIRDFVFGRSRSEGNKLLLIPASREKKMDKSCFSPFTSRRKSAAMEAEKKGKKGKKGKKNRGAVKELDMATSHRIYHSKEIAGGGHMAIGGLRRSFLPYRQELLAGCFCPSRTA